MRRSTMIAVLAAIVVTAAACGGGGSPGQSPATLSVAETTIGEQHEATTLELWGPWGGEQEEPLEAIIEACTAEYAWMTVDYVPKDDLGTVLQTAVTGGSPPDAALVFDYDRIPQWATQEVVYSLDEFASRDAIDWGGFVAGAQDFSQFNGTHYGLPVAMDAYALYYDIDLLEDAGIDGPPTTLSELWEMNDALTVVNDDGSIERAGFLPDYYGSYLGFYAALFGAEAYSADGTTVTIAETGGLQEALEWQQQYYDKYGVDNVRRFVEANGEYDSAEHPWLSGRVAMVMEGEWLASYPDRYLGEGNKNWAVAPMPYPDDRPERENFTVVGGNLLVIPQGSAHAEEAWTLIKCMSHADEEQAAFNDFVKNLPATKAGIEEAKRTADPHFVPFLDLGASDTAVSPRLSVLGSALEDRVGALEQQYINGEVDDLASAIARIQDDLQAELDLALGL